MPDYKSSVADRESESACLEVPFVNALSQTLLKRPDWRGMAKCLTDGVVLPDISGNVLWARLVTRYALEFAPIAE